MLNNVTSDANMILIFLLIRYDLHICTYTDMIHISLLVTISLHNNSLCCLTPWYTSHILCPFWVSLLLSNISIILIQGVNSGRNYTPVEEDEYVKGKSRKNGNVRVDRNKRYEYLVAYLREYNRHLSLLFFEVFYFLVIIFIWEEHGFSPEMLENRVNFGASLEVLSPKSPA